MIQAEQAIIGGILLDGMDAILQVRGIVDPGSFAHMESAKLYSASIELAKDKAPIDIISLEAKTGIPSGQIAEYASRVPTAQGLPYYARIVKDSAISRELERQCLNTIKLLHEQDQDPNQLIARLTGSLSDITQCQETTLSIDRLITKLTNQAEAESQGKKAKQGCSFGIKELDEKLTFGGLPLRQVSVVAGATSKGKSSLAAKVVLNTALKGESVLVCSFEDSPESFTARLISAYSGINNASLQRSIVPDNAWPKYTEACSKLFKTKIHFIDRVPSIEDLIPQIQQHVKKHNTKLVVLDYLQLIRAYRAYSKKQDLVDYIFSMIVTMALDMQDTATLLISQLRRTHNDKPTIEDLYHSGSLEQGSHTILLLWDPDLREHKTLPCKGLIIGKQKNGPTGVIVLGWDSKTTSFFDANEDSERQYKAILSNFKE